MSEAAVGSTAGQNQLVRALGVSHASSVVVGTIIGSGIFLVPTEMMQAVGSSRLVYLAWLVGGVLSFFGAVSYAELAAMKPQAGGEYVFVRDGYGPLGGFLYAWSWFTVVKPAGMAAIAMGLARILGTFSALSFLPHPVLRWPILVTWAQIVAMAAVIFISTLNYVGVKKAGEFHLFFTLLKIAIILAIVGVSFAYVRGGWVNFASHYEGARGGFGGFMTALIAALWAYEGWNLVTMLAAEIKNPQRNLPIALIAGVSAVAVLYILMYTAVQFVMPAAGIAASPQPASRAMELAMGPVGAAIVSAGMALSMLVTLNGSTMTGARVPFALARDGYFFAGLARVHERFHTPSTALVAQGILALLFVLFGGTFQDLFSLSLLAAWLFYLLATAAVFILRRKEPQAPRPYRTWGYPVVPVLFMLAAGLVLYYTFRENLRNSITGSLLIVAGIPLFWFFARRRKLAA